MRFSVQRLGRECDRRVPADIIAFDAIIDNPFPRIHLTTEAVRDHTLFSTKSLSSHHDTGFYCVLQPSWYSTRMNVLPTQITLRRRTPACRQAGLLLT